MKILTGGEEKEALQWFEKSVEVAMKSFNKYGVSSGISFSNFPHILN